MQAQSEAASPSTNPGSKLAIEGTWNTPVASVIFILGLHRSGTTLLYQLLSSTGAFRILTASDVVRLSHEPDALLNGNSHRRMEMLLDRLEKLRHATRGIDNVNIGPETPEEYGFVLSNRRAGWSLSGRNFELFDSLCRSLLDGSASRPLLLKNPWDFGNASFIASHMPTAKFLFLHRNPWDVISSTQRMMAEYLRRPNPYLALLSKPYERFVDAGFPYGLARWICSSHPRLLVRGIVARSSTMASRFLRERRRLAPSAQLDVKFEDLCDRPDAALARILAFLGAPQACPAHRESITRPASRVTPEVIGQSRLIASRFHEYVETFGYKAPSTPQPSGGTGECFSGNA